MLSPRQKKLIEYMIANPDLPETECAKNCGVPNSTYFFWKSKEEFRTELSQRIKEVWADSERMAVDVMQNLAREGNYNAAKYILDNLGYKPTDKVQLEAEVNNTITITIDQDNLDG